MQHGRPRSRHGHAAAARAAALREDDVDGRVVGIRRGGTKAFSRPRHDTPLADGDILTLDIPAENLAKLK